MLATGPMFHAKIARYIAVQLEIDLIRDDLYLAFCEPMRIARPICRAQIGGPSRSGDLFLSL